MSKHVISFWKFLSSWNIKKMTSFLPPWQTFYEVSFCEGIFPGGSDGKESTGNARDPYYIPGLGRSPGEGNGNPLQYSCLGNPMDRGGGWAVVHRVAKSWTQLSD